MNKADLERVVYLVYQVLTDTDLRTVLMTVKSDDLDHLSELNKTVEQVIHGRLREMFARDNCELCLGAKGGVRGNENVFEGIVVCDYCSSILSTALLLRDNAREEKEIT